MKKHISVFNLMTRVSLRKILLILLAMAVSQVILFFVMGAGEETYLLDALQRIPSSVVVYIGLFLMLLALCTPLSDRGGRMNNLILRLGLSEKNIYWLHVLFCAMAYWLFIMAQALIMILLCLIHDWVTPGDMDPMAVFVTSYQHPLFHRFFPLHDLIGWVNHLLLVAGLSICTAAQPIKQRHRYNSICTAIMLVFAVNHFSSLDAFDHLHFFQIVLTFFVMICVVPICLYGVLSMEVDDYGKT